MINHANRMKAVTERSVRRKLEERLVMLITFGDDSCSLSPCLALWESKSNRGTANVRCFRCRCRVIKPNPNQESSTNKLLQHRTLATSLELAVGWGICSCVGNTEVPKEAVAKWPSSAYSGVLPRRKALSKWFGSSFRNAQRCSTARAACRTHGTDHIYL